MSWNMWLQSQGWEAEILSMPPWASLTILKLSQKKGLTNHFWILWVSLICLVLGITLTSFFTSCVGSKILWVCLMLQSKTRIITTTRIFTFLLICIFYPSLLEMFIIFVTVLFFMGTPFSVLLNDLHHVC